MAKLEHFVLCENVISVKNNHYARDDATWSQK